MKRRPPSWQHVGYAEMPAAHGGRFGRVIVELAAATATRVS
jgi:hypothetical protein